MQLYHFTAAHLYKKIATQGITLGAIADLIDGQVEIRKGIIWLSDQSEPEQQTWHSQVTIPYSRLAVRIKLDIPKNYYRCLWKFDDYIVHPNRKIDSSAIKFLKRDHDSSHWYLFENIIPVKWFSQITHYDFPAKKIRNPLHPKYLV